MTAWPAAAVPTCSAASAATTTCGARPGDDRLYGGDGDDSLTDWVPTSFGADAPADDDYLSGGDGDDFVGIMNGADVVLTGAGDDLVKLEDDGAADSVDCGDGSDKVLYYSPVDPLDTLVGCERVTVVE